MGLGSAAIVTDNVLGAETSADYAALKQHAASLPSDFAEAPAVAKRPLQDRRRPLIQIAPMMEITYRDFRHFVRLLSHRTELWTEMVVANALLKAERVDGWLDFGPEEHPVVFQLGGSCPSQLAAAAKMAERQGYDQVNLNCGCPSDKVSGKGEFGASLMKKPDLVRDCVVAMIEAVDIPVTVKCRLGVDDLDSPEFTAAFVRTVASGGVRHFIIHARKCLLNGLSPAQNRTIPPLMYDRVYRLCREFPDLNFTLNGGVTTLEQLQEIQGSAPSNLIGVMIGRAAHGNPCILARADSDVYGEASNPSTASSRHAILSAYLEWLDREHGPGSSSATSMNCGGVLGALKPILGVFNGVPGNKLYRQALDKFGHDKDLRLQGAGAVLRKVIATLEANGIARAGLHAALQQPDSRRPEDSEAQVVQKAATHAAEADEAGAATSSQPTADSTSPS
eukprot:TRINITY_DN16567_c0_g1_i1.p1 TRINITY_DN16567_c0_g1~~TRINITY_DN16567_c0_g1_i1.p1  ORF type:complete len:450 (-),score=78.31 TRINITY_DN16567_c0_g1_i1:22-1371(-)